MKYKIAIAGSSKFTVQMAEALECDERFELVYSLSPTPRLIGREQVLTKNPLHTWSLQNNLPALLIEKKIDAQLAEQIRAHEAIDFLLVVDFGYLIPKWLLALPKIAPLNIHPSLLPKWRGSSPGQFALLCQDHDPDGQHGAVTLMVMDEQLDQGPIIAQLPFMIETNWTQREYYQTAFTLIAGSLGELISDFAVGKIRATSQPSSSPTMIARRLSKADSQINWPMLRSFMSKPLDTSGENSGTTGTTDLLTELLIDQRFCPDRTSQLKLINNACKAFAPWPELWTLVPTGKGEKRMKILACHLDTTHNCLILDTVQIEGKKPCTWNEGKNAILS